MSNLNQIVLGLSGWLIVGMGITGIATGQTTAANGQKHCCDKCDARTDEFVSVSSQEQAGTRAIKASTVENAAGAEPETIAFRLSEWKQLHFDSAEQAQQHLETVQGLGCEVRQGKHGNHIDVGFRCTEWKSMDVANHELVEQWQQWLNSAGFDVSHGHLGADFRQGSETVQFRLVEWKSMHGDGSAEEKQFIETLKKIGCEVRTKNHDGHSDIGFRAPTWREIRVGDHSIANQWMDWLKANGFECRHDH